MTNLQEQLVDKLGAIPEHVKGGLYRYGHTFYAVEADGVTLTDTERMANKLKLSWSEPLEVFSWVDAILSSDDPAAVDLARLIQCVYSDALLEVTAVGTSPDGLVAMSRFGDSGYAVSATYTDGYFRLVCHATGDEYVAGTPEGAAYRAGWLEMMSRPFRSEDEKGGV